MIASMTGWGLIPIDPDSATEPVCVDTTEDPAALEKLSTLVDGKGGTASEGTWSQDDIL
ncbi:hypothetical protein [Stieleria maiorica]|uniref:hypothetical protein n=1 Tax=Stieleria maiorica TaxID=2795974 RepID=UPI001F3F5371|nr:hypothetical protein [Stieleria maiorica]